MQYWFGLINFLLTGDQNENQHRKSQNLRSSVCKGEKKRCYGKTCIDKPFLNTLNIYYLYLYSHVFVLLLQLEFMSENYYKLTFSSRKISPIDLFVIMKQNIF